MCRQNEMKATRCTQGCHDNKSKARSMKKIPVFSNYEKDINGSFLKINASGTP